MLRESKSFAKFNSWLHSTPLMNRVKNIGQNTAEARAARKHSKMLGNKYKVTKIQKNPRGESIFIAGYNRSRLRKKVNKATKSIEHKVEGSHDPRPRVDKDTRVENVTKVPVKAIKTAGKIAGGLVGGYGLYRLGKHAHKLYKARQVAKAAIHEAPSKLKQLAKHPHFYHALGAGAAAKLGVAALMIRHYRRSKKK